MNRTAVLLLVTVTGLPLSLFAVEQRCPFAIVKYTENPPVVDGVLDEDCWKQAMEFGDFVKGDDNAQPADPQTSFKVVYDQECIYFGIRAREPDLAGVVIKPVKRDVWPTGDSIEIFLDPLGDQHTYYQLVSNLAGDQYDGYQKDKLWDGDWETAVRFGKDSWAMEIAVPFTTLNVSVPGSGDAWGGNVCRNGKGYYCTWAEVGNGFHNPAKYNTLIFDAFQNWWDKSLLSLKAQSEMFHQDMRKTSLPVARLEQRLDNADRIRAELGRRSKQEVECPAGYHQLKALQMKYQEIADEMKAITALHQAAYSAK